jgi:hypothetical protein
MVLWELRIAENGRLRNEEQNYSIKIREWGKTVTVPVIPCFFSRLFSFPLELHVVLPTLVISGHLASEKY